MPKLTGPGSTRKRIQIAPFSRGLDEVFANNRAWSEEQVADDPEFFSSLKDVQKPQIVWIGCSDSRVVANQLMGLLPGEVFVQRNVGNQFMHTDMNGMSCIEYAVTALGVKHIVLCGHYNCGAVKAALSMPSKDRSIVNCWISGIRSVRNQHAAELVKLDRDEQVDRLVELNVMAQSFNVCTSTIVQDAWAKGQELHVHGVVYGLANGQLNRLIGPISSMEDLIQSQQAFGASRSSPTTFREIHAHSALSDSPPSSNDGGLLAISPGEPGVHEGSRPTDSLSSSSPRGDDKSCDKAAMVLSMSSNTLNQMGGTARRRRTTMGLDSEDPDYTLVSKLSSALKTHKFFEDAESAEAAAAASRR